ncbi:MAG TPA: porin family protein [Bacteroidales bacterium]
MKKTLLILLLFILFLIPGLKAQHKPFQFGFSGGANIGWWATDAENYSNKGIQPGGSWGFVADIFMMEGYSFTTGFNVLYLNGQMEMPYKVDGQEGNVDRIYKTQYVELPLIFTMKTNEIKEKFRIYGQIGFGLSFLLRAKGIDTFSPASGGKSTESEKNIYDKMTFTRESLIIGVGAEVPIHESTYARVGLKFDNAFVNVLKGYNTANSSIKNNGRNSLMELNVAIIF